MRWMIRFDCRQDRRPDATRTAISARGQVIIPAVGKLQIKTAVKPQCRRFRHRVVCPIPEFEAQVTAVASSCPPRDWTLFHNSPQPARLRQPGLSLELGTTNAYLASESAPRVLMPASPSNTIESLSNPR